MSFTGAGSLEAGIDMVSPRLADTAGGFDGRLLHGTAADHGAGAPR